MNERNLVQTTNPKRILHVTGGMNAGGAETMIMHLYRKIDRNKIQFDFVSFTDAQCHYDNEIRALGGHIFHVHPPKLDNLVGFVKNLYKIIKKNGPYHAVHAHTLFNSGLALFAARLAGVKLRVCHSHTTMDNYSDSFVRKIYFTLMRVLIAISANKRIACTKAAGRFLFGKKSDQKQKFSVLPNAIDLTPFKHFSANETKDICEKLGINKNTIVIGHVGNFGEQKNQIFLVRLAEYMRGKGIDFKFILIGRGKMMEKIEAEVKEKGLDEYVKLLGMQTNIPLFMSLFNVFVFPSLYEGLGIVLIEAQAAGTPCIISDTIPDEADMGLGLITRLSLKDNLEFWYNAILYNKKTRKIPAEITTKAIMKKGYSLDATVKSLFDIYGLTGSL